MYTSTATKLAELDFSKSINYQPRLPQITSTLTKNIPKNTSEFLKMSTALNNLKSGFSGSNIELVNLGKSMTGLSNAQKIAQVSGLQLSNTQKALMLQSAGLSAAETKTALATTTLDVAQKSAATSTITFGGAIKGLGMAIASHPIMFAVTAITAVISVISIFNQKMRKQSKKQKSLQRHSATRLKYLTIIKIKFWSYERH